MVGHRIWRVLQKTQKAYPVFLFSRFFIRLKATLELAKNFKFNKIMPIAPKQR